MPSACLQCLTAPTKLHNHAGPFPACDVIAKVQPGPQEVVQRDAQFKSCRFSIDLLLTLQCSGWQTLGLPLRMTPKSALPLTRNKAISIVIGEKWPRGMLYLHI